MLNGCLTVNEGNFCGKAGFYALPASIAYCLLTTYNDCFIGMPFTCLRTRQGGVQGGGRRIKCNIHGIAVGDAL
jgi:hypothetical protein